MVEYDLAKVETGVRFSSLAPFEIYVELLVRFFFISKIYHTMFHLSSILSECFNMKQYLKDKRKKSKISHIKPYVGRIYTNRRNGGD